MNDKTSILASYKTHLGWCGLYDAWRKVLHPTVASGFNHKQTIVDEYL